MPSVISNIFSNDVINFLLNSQETMNAKAKITSSNNVVYFTIPLTESIRNAILTQFDLDFSNVSEIPMRWIKGDTSPHIDVGYTQFENTYLAYISDSEGEFVLDNTHYPIHANTGFMFNEGLNHMTHNTGNVPRLLLGPMNEFAQPVGNTPIVYYDNYANAYAQNGNIIAAGGSFILGENIYYGSIGTYTSWRVANTYNATLPTGIYNNGFDLLPFGSNLSTYHVYPEVPCFLEGTKILCQVEDKEVYLPIETIKQGTLVKTIKNGYKKVEVIGKGSIKNPGNNERSENRLYKCSVGTYPELNEDLYLTGCHSILVDTITDIQKEKTIQHLGEIFVTERKYRLMAFLDELAEPWASEGDYTIWHLALENIDEKMNYGIYANGGLTVETCSINFMKNKSNLTIE